MSGDTTKKGIIVATLAAAAVGGKFLLMEGGAVAIRGAERAIEKSTATSGKQAASATRDVAHIRGASTGLGEKNLNSAPTLARAGSHIASQRLDTTEREIVTLLDRAEPAILNDLRAKRGILEEQAIRKVVSNEIAKSTESAAKANGDKYKFEILTGKLTITPVNSIGSLAITGGEINVYKISGYVAAFIYSCSQITSNQIENCVKDGFSELGKYIKSMRDTEKKSE